MTISRTQVESKPDSLQPTDEEIIKFVNDNRDKFDILTNYFSKLSRPLTPAILCMLISEDQKSTNLLGYAAIANATLFAAIVKLATPDAINAALLQEPADTEGFYCALYAILMSVTDESENCQSIIVVLQKASQEAIDFALPKIIAGFSTLLFAIMSVNEAVTLELVKKSSPAALNAAAKMIAGVNILHAIIEGKRFAVASSLLPKLDRETMDLLMQTPDLQGNTPFRQLLSPMVPDEEERDLFACALIKHS